MSKFIFIRTNKTYATNHRQFRLTKENVREKLKRAVNTPKIIGKRRNKNLNCSNSKTTT